MSHLNYGTSSSISENNPIKLGQSFFMALAALSVLCFVSGYVGASWQQIVIFASADPVSNPNSLDSLLRRGSSNLPIIFVSYLIDVGISSDVISRIISGLTLWFSGVTFFLTAYALTKRASYSFCIAIIGLMYPLIYYTAIYDLQVSTGITNAEFGPLIPALAIAIFACRLHRTGFLVLGFLPTLHLPLGAWTLAGVILILGLSKEGRSKISSYTLFAVPGLLTLVIIILSAHFKYISVPPFKFLEHNQYVMLFSDNLCHHFMTVENVMNGLGLLNLSALVIFLLLCGIVLFVFSKYHENVDIRYTTKIYSIFLLVSVVSAFVFGLLASYPETVIGSTALRVMPLRFVGSFTSIAGIVLLSVLIQSSWQLRRQQIVTLLFLTLVILTLLNFGKSRLIIWILLFFTITVMPHPLLSRLQRFFDQLLNYSLFRNQHLLVFAGKNWIYIFMCLSLLFVGTANVQRSKNGSYWNYWKNDQFWSAINDTRGTVLVASGMPLAQIIIGRQLTVWTEELGTLPYAPQAGPAVSKALNDLYGIDLFNADKSIDCSLKYESEKEVWSNRSYEEWLNLSKLYDFSAVVAPSNWNLNLKSVATILAEKSTFKVLSNGANTITHFEIAPK